MIIDWNLEGFYDLRRAPEVVDEIDRLASDLADASAAADGGEYGWESHQGRKAPQGRWRATVFTKDQTARENNAKHNTLLNELGSL